MLQKEQNSVHCSGGILADDQGLGKTISMIALIQMQRSLSKPKSDDSCVPKTEALNLDDDDDDKGTTGVKKAKQAEEFDDLKLIPQDNEDYQRWMLMSKFQVYKASTNCEMVNGVNLFGPKCEYVVSGSNCGRKFISRKKDAELIRVVQADKHVVNCIESHTDINVGIESGKYLDTKSHSGCQLCIIEVVCITATF